MTTPTAFVVFLLAIYGVSASDTELKNLTCRFSGQKTSTDQWLGFPANVTGLTSSIRFQFSITFEEDTGPTDVIMYNATEVSTLNANMTCDEKVDAASWSFKLNGTWTPCNNTGRSTYECVFSKNLLTADGDRFVAFSSCGETGGIAASYVITAEGVGASDACPDGTISAAHAYDSALLFFVTSIASLSAVIFARL